MAAATCANHPRHQVRPDEVGRRAAHVYHVDEGAVYPGVGYRGAGYLVGVPLLYPGLDRPSWTVGLRVPVVLVYRKPLSCR